MAHGKAEPFTIAISDEVLADLRERLARTRLPGEVATHSTPFLQALYRAFIDTDASLLEINPCVLTGDAKLVALDAKMTFDDNALFRHPNIR